jgi:hypothetical protein
MPTEVAIAVGIADDWAEKISAYAGSEATVSREYDTPADERELKSIEGRLVWVFPDTYTWTPVTRGKDDGDVVLQIVVAERFTELAEKGRPPKAWLDERVLWVEKLWRKLADQRGESVKWPVGEEGAVPVLDPQMLREFGIFWVNLPALTIRKRIVAPANGG